MTLKSITLHRAASDNLSRFVDAGNDLVVGDEAKAGVISADRAREIVESHGAVGHYSKPAADKPKKPAAKPAARKTVTPAAPTPAVPTPPAPEPAADQPKAD